ncbi:unnamed protein product [Cyclocybe aegerita]|uniref:Uncharacterized protein n=1 Tax=Cyclocybe aegerita TaxID=1973307 RepID=A0A8S0WFS3_CYCAE|nr:unnamed protein product [Cyclocybe aegerita]
MQSVSILTIYEEPALCYAGTLKIPRNMDVKGLRGRVHRQLHKHFAQRDHEFVKADILHPNPDAILLATDQSSFAAFEDGDKVIHFEESDQLYAFVPAAFKNETSGRPSTAAAGVSLTALQLNQLQSLVIDPMGRRIQELQHKNAAAQERRNQDVAKEREQKAKVKKELKEAETLHETTVLEMAKQRSDQFGLLMARMDRMEVEHREMDERLRCEKDELEERLRCENDELEERLRGEKEELEARLRNEKDGLEDRLMSEIKDLKEQVGELENALTSALIDQDLTPMHCIRLRALLDDVQGDLAKAVSAHANPPPGLTPNDAGTSWAWRALLDAESKHDGARIKYARSLLKNLPQFASLHDSDAAMTVICQRRSAIRRLGNDMAHRSLKGANQISDLRGAVVEENGKLAGFLKRRCSWGWESFLNFGTQTQPAAS